MTDPADTFLVELGAESIGHPGGTLLSHLRRVRDLLREWECDPDVVTAGLSHAVYGTDGFDTALVDVGERDTVRARIGDSAEHVVYRYASCDRSPFYPNVDRERPELTDRFTGERVMLTKDEAAAIAVLTAANELDVVRHSEAMAERHGDSLRKLMTRMARHLPEAARQAWAQR